VEPLFPRVRIENRDCVRIQSFLEASPAESYLAESRVATVQGVMWVMTIVPLVFRVFGWDEFIISIAIGCLVAYAAVCHVASKPRLGRQLAVVAQHPDNLNQVALLCDTGKVLVILAFTLGKTSFAVTMLRFVVHRWMVVLLWFVIVTMNVVNVLAVLFVLSRAKTLDMCGTLRSHQIIGHLMYLVPLFFLTSQDVLTSWYLAYYGAQDFVLALLSWKIMWGLQMMKKKERLGIAFAMSLGVFGTCTHCLGAAVEDGLAITAASISAIKPLLIRAFPGSSTGEHYNMISYPTRPSQQKVFDISQGETHTDIGHTSIHDRGSQTAILELGHQQPKWNERISMTTEVSVTYVLSP
ncbi:hypothetical protein N7532_007554, partial [Penicillium argentinense]